MGNKYLYSKVMSSRKDKVQLLVTDEELSFLKSNHINFTVGENNYVTVNKAQFLEEVAAA